MLRALLLGSVLLACAGCAIPTGGGDESGADVARSLIESYGPSQSTRYQDARCAPAVGGSDANYVCALELVGLRRGEDAFVVTSVIVRDGKIAGGFGLTRIEPACMADPRCWASMASSCGLSCDGLPPTLGKVNPPIGDRRIDRPLTTAGCIEAWNIHGGFSPDEVADRAPPMLPTQAVTKPVYTPYLAAASIGYLSSRAEVMPQMDGCEVVFDLGNGNGYRITTAGGPDPWVWTWQGDATLSGAPPAGNACQHADGTLSAGGCEPPSGVTPRDVEDELGRRYLAAIATIGGTPYWLGAPFDGALPDARAEGDLLLVSYTLTAGDHPVTLTIYRGYGPAIPAAQVEGRVIVRAHFDGGAVVVTADATVSKSLRRDVRRELRPFLATDPTKEQMPGDLESTPTLVDSRQPRRPLWFGPTLAGLSASVITDSPAGVGVVRYGSATARDRFYVVTYRPLPKECGALGCVSPPPLPHSLLRYGRETHLTYILSDEWIATILAPRPAAVADAIAGLNATSPTPAR